MPAERISLSPSFYVEPEEGWNHLHDVYTTTPPSGVSSPLWVGALTKDAVEAWRLAAAGRLAPQLDTPIREDIAALIRRHIRLEWHGPDSAQINHWSTEVAAEMIVAALCGERPGSTPEPHRDAATGKGSR